jgi:outer membrane protein assembly factor BamA
MPINPTRNRRWPSAGATESFDGLRDRIGDAITMTVSSRVLVVLVVLAIVAACGGQVRVRAPEAGADHLGAIRIEGNHAIATGALEPALALHEAIRDGAAMDPYLLTVDAERIRAAYLRRGFFEVKVAPGVEHGGDHTQTVVFTITEGRRAVTRVEIAGLPAELPPASTRARVVLRDGAPFDYDLYDDAKQPLRALVENAGYAYADVHGTVVIDPIAATATARYEVVSGVRCTFGAIRISGPVPAALVSAIRARLQFAAGDRYSVSALEASQAEIYDLGRFSTVRVVPDRSGDGGAVVAVAIEVAEANRYELHGGGGFGYEPATYEARLRGGGSLVPASLPLLTLAIDTRVAVTIPHSLARDQLEPKIRGLVSLQYLDLLWPRLRGDVEAGADYQTVEAYTWTGEHVRLGLGTPLGPRWLQLRAGWVLEHLTFSKLEAALDPAMAPGCPTITPPTGDTPAQRLGLCRTQLRGAYQASLVADLRDNPIEPHRGVYVDLRVTKGTQLAGGDLAYLQLTPEVRGYVSVGGVVIAARARVGAIFGEVPVTERYYSGGTSGQRGFSERRLSPTASQCAGRGSSVVIGGAGLIETGIELRRQLGTLGTLPVGANVFLDGGDARCTPEALDLSQLSWAIGAGGWAKLVGDLKIRIDAGYRLNSTSLYPRSSDSDALANVAFHIGLGEVY